MDTEEKFDVSTQQIYVLVREVTYDFIKDQYNIEDFPVEDTDSKLIKMIKLCEYAVANRTTFLNKSTGEKTM